MKSRNRILCYIKCNVLYENVINPLLGHVAYMQHPLFRYIVIYGHTRYSCNVVFLLISFMRDANSSSILN